MMSIEELTELFLKQKKMGNPESPEDFAARYPEQCQELLSLLPALAAIEEMNNATQPMSGHVPTAFPRRLGDFCLHERIGSGGMGSVYRATQLSLDRDVALKILSPTLASDDEIRQRFVDESKIIATLHHPNIVNVYGAGYEQGWCFYVMELIDGKAMDCDTFADDPDRLRKITEVARQSADALAYAHGAHILHRDFKLANLLRDQQGNIHLSDFGISSVLKDNAAIQVTRTQEGTLRYMAPEIFLNGTYGFASDQYGFGVSMYELITGKPCYSELTSGKIVHEICDHRFPKLSGTYSDLGIVINKCTSYHAADRYSSMSEVRDDLSRILNHEPIRARKTPLLRRTRLWMRRRPAVAALLIASSILLFAFLSAIVIGYWQTSQGLKREIAQRTLAERNAKVANETLKKIFERSSGHDYYDTEALTSSPAMLDLLYDLIPYYEEIQKQAAGTHGAFMADVRLRLGKIAMRAGKYDLAKQMFALAQEDYAPDSLKRAECMNQKALADLRSGDEKSARETWSLLADNYEKSNRLECRLIAVDALRQLTCLSNASGRRRFRLQPEEDRACLNRANGILKTCGADSPDNPEIRFLAACFSAAFPDWREKFTPDGNPYTILRELAEQYPKMWKYQIEFIQLVLRTPFRRGGNADEQKNVAAAVSFAERLLVVMPFDEKLIADTMALYQRKSFRQRGGRNRFESYREQWHLIGFLKPIAIHPQTSDASRELMLDFLLTQMQNASNRNRSSDSDILLHEIQNILSFYHGAKKAEFQARLDKLK